MANPMKSNLEPVEEADLDLEGKFKRGETRQSMQEVPMFAPEREVPQEISAAEKDSAYGKILSKVQGNTDDGGNVAAVAQDAQTGALLADAQSQVQHLVDIAMQKGVVHAVKVARHMEDNYVLDTFHDHMLSDELHDALVQKGVIKEL